MGLIGSALGAAGAIFGGIKATEAKKNVKRNIEAQRQKNRNWYDRRYNEDSTQRAEAQLAIKRLHEDVRNRNKAAAGVQAVMGGTEESVAAAKAANNEAVADTTSRIVAASEARKDQIEATYLQNDNAYQEQLNQMEQAKAQGIAEAAKGVAGAGDNLDLGMIKIGGKEYEL